MKQVLFNIILCGIIYLSINTVHAQATIDYDDIVAPASEVPREFDDFLVQRAWFNNANTNALTANVEVAKLDKKVAKRDWLNQVNANVNLTSQRDEIMLFNEQWLAPGFNYGLSINVGGIVNNKLKVKQADQMITIAEAKENQTKMEFRAAVLDRLEMFDNSKELLTIRRRAEIDAETNYKLVQSLYDQGKAQFEDLARASEVYFRATAATSLAKSNVNRTRITLEEIVGQPYSELEKVREKMAVTSKARKKRNR